jgi:competence protein ComFC
MENSQKEKTESLFKKIGSFLIDLFFPKKCIGCGKEGRYICEKCSTFLGEASLICPVCEKGSFSGERHKSCSSRYKLDGLVSVWEYEGLAKAVIHNIKYRCLGDAVSEFTKLSFRTILKDKERFASFLNFVFSENPLITYVPMTRRKEMERKINHTEMIAKELSKIIKVEIRPLLKKIKETESQTKLSKEERKENVKGVFSLREEGMILPQKIILVDDVWTTGATMRECCKVLKKGGVEKVWSYTFARTV